MLKSTFVLLTVLFSVNSFAAPKYQGVWCQKFDDFTEFFIFDEKNNVEVFSRGNQTGEVILHQKGYASLGANGFRVILEKSDIGVVDYEKTLTGQLVLLFENGSRQKYSKCDDPRGH